MRENRDFGTSVGCLNVWNRYWYWLGPRFIGGGTFGVTGRGILNGFGISELIGGRICCGIRGGIVGISTLGDCGAVPPSK